MARVSVQELRDAVVTAIQENGPDVEYEVLTANLTASGNGAAIPMLRQMKHERIIGLRLERGEDGVLRHFASLPAQEQV